jgi:hypothetical protein
MSDISNQLIKDSYNYVLQSDLSSGTVYRIGGSIPVNPKFLSGLTINGNFIYSNGTEQNGYALLTDGTGYAYWGPVSASTPSSGVTSITATNGLSGDVTTGAVTIVNTAPDQTVTITGGTNIEITGSYPDFGVNYTGTTTIQGITGITGSSGVSASTTDYGTTIINTAPDQTVTITGGTNIQIISSYPNFGINFTGTTSGGLEYFVTGATPTATQSGDRWFNTDTGVELVWIEDGDSNQWVQPFSVPGPLSPDVGYYSTTGITTGQTLTWDKTYWGISGSSNVNLTLPSVTAKEGYYLIIKDEAGICGTYRIRLSPTSGTIDGNNYVDMNINYMSLTCMVRGGNWYLI